MPPTERPDRARTAGASAASFRPHPGRRLSQCTTVTLEESPFMRTTLFLFACLTLVSCSDSPTTPASKPVEKPSEPVTGRQAFQLTFPSARGWAADAQPITVRNMNLAAVKSEGGKAGAWEVVYVSPSKRRTKTYTWSAVEDGSLHKGVFSLQDQSWGGPSGQQNPFPSAAIKTDTSEALKTATEESESFLKKEGPNPPQVLFLLEFTPRFPDPVWRVMWGDSVGSAKRTVFVDAATGELRGAN